MTRVESFEETAKDVENGCMIHTEEQVWLKEIAGSLAVIADAMEYNQSYDKACYEAAQRM